MFQKITSTVGKGVLWIWMGILLLLSLGAFSSSAAGGVVLLLAAAIGNPLFFRIYRKYEKSARLKAVTILLSFLLMLCGVMLVPQAAVSEQTEVSDAESAPEQTGLPDAESTPEQTELSDAESAPEQTELSDAESAPEQTELPDAESTPEQTGLPDAESAMERTELSDAESAPEQTELPDAESTPEQTELSDAESAMEQAGVSGAESAVRGRSDVRADSAADTETGEPLEVHFLDVGQGDCTLLRCGDASMLIDTGADDNGTKIQNYLKKQGVRKLDYLVLTHPDADHIGSADVIVTKFEIGTLFASAYTKENKTCARLAEAEQYRHLKPVTPTAGDTYLLGDAEVIFLSSGQAHKDPNNSSLALRVAYGKTSFLFTGDCEEDAEKELLESGLSLKSDVYQVGHHGSRDASSKEFLEAAAPDYAVISCAAENEYGHPHAQTLNNLRAMGVKLYRTDEQGTIVAVTDGEKITFNCSDTQTWKAGESTAAQTSVKSGKSKSTAAAKDGEKQSGAAKDGEKQSGAAKDGEKQSGAAKDGEKQSGAKDGEKQSTAAAGPEQGMAEEQTNAAAIQEGATEGRTDTANAQGSQFILNKKSGVLHQPSCSRLPLEKNQILFETAEEAMASPQYDHKCSYCW